MEIEAVTQAQAIAEKLSADKVVTFMATLSFLIFAWMAVTGWRRAFTGADQHQRRGRRREL